MEKRPEMDKKDVIPVDKTGLEYGKWKTGTAFPVSAGVCRLDSHQNAFNLHWHDGPELSVVLEGRMEYLVNDKRYVLETGDCVFVNSGAMHAGRTLDAAPCRYLVVSFLTSVIGGATEGAFAEIYFGGVMDAGGLPSLVFRAGAGDAAAYCRAVFEACKGRGDGWELSVKSSLCLLWGTLYREAKRCNPESPEHSASVARIKKAIRYMNENYAAKLTLEDIAAACNLSKSEFCRSFKRITRRTAFDFLMDLRIRKSLRLLEQDGASVTETALSSGFSGSSYYTEIFRRYMNCTPREYLRQKRGGR